MKVGKVVEADVLVVGGGGAGERAAYEALAKGAKVAVCVKGKLGTSGCTARAVSELSAYSAAFSHADPRDNPYFHFRDTVDQGGGLCDQVLVRQFVLEAPKRLLEVESFGASFVKQGERFEQLLADASTLPRACHAGADTGREIAAALKRQIEGKVDLYEDAMVTRLLTYRGAVVGAVALDLREGEIIVFKAKSTVLATGGAGRMYWLTAQPADVTGDGFALAYRVGADLVNMEFIQIGPALVYPITGYLLVTRFWRLNPRICNARGEEFVHRYVPKGVTISDVLKGKQYSFPFIVESPGMHLDVAMHTEIREGRGTEHGGVYLDVSHNPPEVVEQTVPVSFKWLLERSIDIRKQPLEIAPVIQCFIGGVRYDRWARTRVDGLFVCGEVSGGLHGAARPGGNLLALSQVFGAIAGRSAAERALPIAGVRIDEEEVNAEVARIESLLREGGEPPSQVMSALRRMMWDNVACVRNEEGLASTLSEIERLRREVMPRVGARDLQELREAIELDFMLETARLVTRAALLRTESRGTHYRQDYPMRNDYKWLKVINQRREQGRDRVFLTRPATIESFYLSEEEEVSA